MSVRRRSLTQHLLNHISDPFAAQLAIQAQDRQQEAHRPGTIKARESAIRQFIEFCTRLRISYKQVTYIHVCWYIEYLARRMSSPASISNAISHLRTFYTLVGRSTAPLTHTRVLLALRAISIGMRHIPVSRDPVTPGILKEALANVHRLPNPDTMRLALLLMFMGFLRQSSVAPVSVPKFDYTRHLTKADATLTAAGLRIKVKWTKTMQSSADATSILLPATNDQSVCPVLAYRRYSAQPHYKGGPNTPLLCHKDGNPLTVPYIRRQWATLLATIGKSAQQYSLHSLRRGAAHYTYNACHAKLTDVMQQGTWRSDSVRAYIRPDPSVHTTVHRALRRL